MGGPAEDAEALTLAAGMRRVLRGVGVITRPLVPASDGPDDEVLRARIVHRLERLGPVPAASFHDACILMDGDPPVASDAHLVGHLVRELESSMRAALLPPGTHAPSSRPEEATTAGAEAHGRTGAVLQAVRRLVHALGDLIRAVFQPPDARVPRPHEEAAVTSAAHAHRLEVRAVLDSLGIACDSDAGKAWLGYAGLWHTRAYWRGPGVPRPVDQEFRRSFGCLVDMLDVVLEEHEARYLASVDRLDALARAVRPGDEHASELRQEFPQDPVTMERFFSLLTSPAWIRPLRNQAFFTEPPAPVAGEDGPGWLPDWPALRYLVRVAGQDPALAVEVAMDIPATENPLVNAGLVDLALEVPAADSVKLLPRISRDLAGGHETVGAQRFCALALHLVDGGMPASALGLARVLWGFAPSPEGIVPCAAGGLGTRMGTLDYAESLRTCLPPLVTAAGPAVLEAMADLLDDAITRTASPAMIESRQDLSTLWRPAVEGLADTDMDAKTALVSGVRDAAEQLVRDRRLDVEDALRRLGSRDWPIFRRLALHLLRRFGAACLKEVARRLTDAAAIRDPFTEREFILLAHDYFAALGAQDQQRVLNLIEQGPDVGRWVATYAAQVGEEPPGNQIDRWAAEWTRDRLGVLEPALPQQTRDSYGELVRLVGEPAPADQTRATSRFMRDFTGALAVAGMGATGLGATGLGATGMGATGMGATGLGATGLAGWSIDRAIGFLQTRPPSATPPVTGAASPTVIPIRTSGVTPTVTPAVTSASAPVPTPAVTPVGSTIFDLAEELGSAVRGSPLRFSAAAGRFAGLPEPYVAQILSGLHAAAAGGADLDWDSILRLCRWVSDDTAPETGLPMAGEPDWRGGRREMILLLRAGLDRVPPVIPIGERERVWQIIDSTLSRNAPACSDGPITADQARASARAEALTAAVSYGIWVRSHDRDADLADVFLALDRHLDPDAEPSLAVRAVYGTEFHRLARLDSAWAASATNRIFPPGEEGRELRDAAWGAYLDVPGPISRDVCALLNDQYRLAVDRIAATSDGRVSTRDVRLGHHLITRYWAGDITLDGGDQLIGRFYKRASTAVREQMTKFIGWNLLSPATVTDAGVLARLTELWEERLATASPSADRDELVGFGEWFASGRFDDAWSLRQLARVITLTGDAKPDILVLSRLAEIATARTLLCVDILNEWVRQLPDDAWLLSAREEYLRRILAAGLASPDPGTKALAEEIINGAADRGHSRFRDLVSAGTA